MRKKPTFERVLEKVSYDFGCWRFNGARSPSGHGMIGISGTKKLAQAHRVVYEHAVGPIPDGFHLDHLCRNPACVNPCHLEPVMPAENIRRGVASHVLAQRQRDKAHCPAGHPYDEANTYRVRGERRCKVCISAKGKIRHAKKKATKE